MNFYTSHPINYFALLLFFFAQSHQYAKSEARVTENDLSSRIYRTWSEWSSWSSCSRSCGPGVAMRTRICRMRLAYHPLPLSKTCAGENIEHKLCDKEKCPSSDEDFITYQCSLHNGHLVAGKLILEWIPYKQNDNPCELQCQAKDGSRLYSFGKVIDGTECGSKNPAICVNGRCTQIDCSGQLGTDGQLDMCGVCRGDNSTCVRYQNSYWGRSRRKNVIGGTSAADQHYDYNHIARIPSGVTRILIKESSETNFLALMDKTGKILINDNWRVTTPGLINTSGTEFTYSRIPSGEDILSAPGPTDSDLFVLVLGSGDIPTVQYEYWYSKKVDHKHMDTQKKGEYYITEDKDPPPGVIVSSLRNKNKYGYDGYRSYYQRNEIFPYQHETKPRQHSVLQLNATTVNAVDIPATAASVTDSFSVAPLALSRQESIGTVQTVATFSQKWIKSKHNVPSPTSDGELDLGLGMLPEISDNRIIPGPSSNLPLAVPSEKNISLTKAGYGYVSNALLPPEHRDVLLNETKLEWRHQKVLPAPSRVTSHYSPLSKSTHSDRGIPSDLKSYHYETGIPSRNLSPTQLNSLIPAQPCTKKLHIQEFRRQDRKRQKTGIHGDPLESYNNKEKKEFPVITKFTHNKRKRDHKDNSRAKISQPGSPDMKSKKRKRKRKSNKDHCLPCSKVKNQNKNFCRSDFVLRIIVTSLHEVRGETQFEVQVIQSYRNQIPILPREYLWRLDSCRCPRLHIGREYLVMGYSGASTARNRESRLYVNGKSFVRRYGRKRASSMQRLARNKDIICKKFVSSKE